MTITIPLWALCILLVLYGVNAGLAIYNAWIKRQLRKLNNSALEAARDKLLLQIDRLQEQAPETTDHAEQPPRETLTPSPGELGRRLEGIEDKGRWEP